MGYQDRDYFRDERRPFLDLIRSSRTCWVIIVVAALFYLLIAFSADSSQPVDEYLQLDSQAMVSPWQWYRLFTAGFVDDQPWHLAITLLLIWLIGHDLEVQAGSREFISFALVCLVISNLTLLMVSWYIHPVRHLPAFGLTGFCVGLWTWATWASPYHTVNLAFIHIPRWILFLLLILLEAFFFMQFQPVALRLAALVPPMLLALIYAQFDLKLTEWYQTFSSSARSSRKAVAHSETRNLQEKRRVLTREMQSASERNNTGNMKIDEQLEAKLDAVLEKVSQSGMQSLSDNEKKILKDASEIMKKRKN
ncbi:MAG: rhomboid family intramembrane serine protease [Planctomycetia bacterium]|nr:rhomboid family intramembrane serine protease [Planctomycetia bacterium]